MSAVAKMGRRASTEACLPREIEGAASTSSPLASLIPSTPHLPAVLAQARSCERLKIMLSVSPSHRDSICGSPPAFAKASVGRN